MKNEAARKAQRKVQKQAKLNQFTRWALDTHGAPKLTKKAFQNTYFGELSVIHKNAPKVVSFSYGRTAASVYGDDPINPKP